MAVWFFLALVRDMNGSEAKNILLLLFMLLFTPPALFITSLLCCVLSQWKQMKPVLH